MSYTATFLITRKNANFKTKDVCLSCLNKLCLYKHDDDLATLRKDNKTSDELRDNDQNIIMIM